MKFISNAKYNQPVESGSIFEAKAGRLRISVHRIHHLDGWYLTCQEIRIHQHKLKSDGFINATKEAREIIKSVIDVMKEDISKAIDESVEISRY